MRMQDERPDHYPLPDRKLVDRFGQKRAISESGKIRSEEELKTALLSRPDSAAPAGWDRWGGWKNLPVGEPRGFFHAVKRDGRWWVADPDGNAFFQPGLRLHDRGRGVPRGRPGIAAGMAAGAR